MYAKPPPPSCQPGATRLPYCPAFSAFCPYAAAHQRICTSGRRAGGQVGRVVFAGSDCERKPVFPTSLNPKSIGREFLQQRGES